MYVINSFFFKTLYFNFNTYLYVPSQAEEHFLKANCLIKEVSVAHFIDYRWT